MRNFEKTIFELYVWMLGHGWHNAVYYMASYFGKKGLNNPFYTASWKIQAELFKLGYQECPSCHWVTKGQCCKNDKS